MQREQGISAPVDVAESATSEFTSLMSRIQGGTASIAVVGMGYVGLATTLEFALAGFATIGLDVDEERVSQLRAGISPVREISSRSLRKLIRSSRIRVATQYQVLAEADVVIVCVPTPLDEAHLPDLAALTSVLDELIRNLRPPQLIVLRSTVFPGATDSLFLSALSRAGFRSGREFFLAAAPERLNFSGDPITTQERALLHVPVVVGGIDDESLDLTAKLFEVSHREVLRVRSARVAEMAKLLENTFRLVNIALIDEFALMSERLMVDVWEIIKAASTKPFGFMPFLPSLGVGGHCIPVDPHYLAWAADAVGYTPQLIATSSLVGEMIPGHILEILERALGSRGVPLAGADILMLGAGFKPDISDTRNSPAIRLATMLGIRGAHIVFHDPYVASIDVPLPEGKMLHLDSIDRAVFDLERRDAVIVATGHSVFDVQHLVENSRLLIDTCGITSQVYPLPTNVRRLGTPSLEA